LADDDLRRHALELELDLAQFEADLQDDDIEKAIRRGKGRSAIATRRAR